jgi:hypothetical protein
MVSPTVQIALFAALSFLVIGSPAVYKLTNFVARGAFTDEYGVPTFLGTLVHALVSGLLMFMYLRMFSF